MLKKLEKLEVEAKFKGWSKFVVISHEVEVDIKKRI